MRSAFWVVGLLGGCIAWALLMSTYMDGVSTSFVENAGLAIGMRLPLFLVTGVGAGAAYAATRNHRKALWTWTILILVGMTGPAPVSWTGTDLSFTRSAAIVSSRS